MNVGKEAQPGSIAAGTYTFPLTTFKPVDKYTRLEDNAWRNAMAQLYNLIDGVRISDVSLGGPFFADGIGYPLMDILGDYWQGVVGGVVGTLSSLAVNSAVGAGTIVVASATGMTSGHIISIGGTATTGEEVRSVTNVSGGTLTLNAPLYQSHGSLSAAGTVFWYTSYTAIQHNFSLLNAGLGGGGWTASQPPTYTYEDFTGVPATYGARNYGYACYSEVSITSEATALVNWEGKMTALASQIATSTPTTSLTTVAPQAAWRSTVSLAGSGTLNISEWKATFQRKIAPKFDNNGQQDPFAIARGYFTAMLGLNQDPAQDELFFIDYLSNAQPTCQLVATNGLAGTLAASITINAQQLGFDTGEINDGKDVFGYDLNAKLIANTVNIGPSGGFSPVSVSLVNQVISY